MYITFGERLAVASGLAALALAACSEQATPTVPQGTLNVDIAPLSLPGIADADYGIVVTNGTDTVWSESSLTSSQYGDGAGSLTYVGTCDAGAVNHVFLTLNSLSDAGGVIPTDTYVNPCPADAPCEAQAACVENEDAAITFNLAVMRDASQGFFDVAVNFQDVFCSAKVDCQDALLFVGVDRVPTAVIGFACTSGKNSAGDTEATTLFTDFQADWGAGASHLDTTTAGNKSDLDEPYAVYIDSEELPGYTKGFVNAAVAIAGGVHITGQATAATSALPVPSSGSAFTSYPVVNFDVEVPASCAGWTGTVKLNAGGGVDTAYVADPRDALYDQTSVAPPGGAPSNPWAVFYAYATNLVDVPIAPSTPGLSWTVPNVYRKNLDTGAIEVLSVDDAGVPASHYCYLPAQSEDGGKVAFTCVANNFGVHFDGWPINLTYVKDTKTGTVSLVSSASDGTPSNGQSDWYTVISGDGRRVGIVNAGSNLGPTDPDAPGWMNMALYVKDLASGALIRADQGSSGEFYTTGPGGYDPSMSYDGTKIAFGSDIRGTQANQVYIRDIDGGTVTQASTAADGTSANGWSDTGRLSRDGQKLLFWSEATNLDSSGSGGLFVKDLTSGAVTKVADNPVTQASWSPDGTKIVMMRGGCWTALHSPPELAVVDLTSGLETAVTHNASVGTCDSFSDLWLAAPMFSADGKKVLFESRFAFASGDADRGAGRNMDVYAADLATGAITLVGTNAAGNPANGPVRFEYNW